MILFFVYLLPQLVVLFHHDLRLLAVDFDLGGQPEGLQVLQRSLAEHALFAGKTRHGHHHGLRAAGADLVERFFLKERMLGDKALFASRPVLGSDEHATIFLKLFQHQQVFGRTGSQQESRFHAAVFQLFSKIKQGKKWNIQKN